MNIEKYKKILLILTGILLIILISLLVFNIFKKPIKTPELASTTTYVPQLFPIIPTQNLQNIIKPTLSQGDCFYSGVYRSLKYKNLLKSRYDIVLELEKRPFIQDGLRIEKDERQVDEIYSRVKDNYSSLGYDFIFVPNFCSDRIYNAKQRADFILENLGDKI